MCFPQTARWKQVLSYNGDKFLKMAVFQLTSKRKERFPSLQVCDASKPKFLAFDNTSILDINIL